MKNPQNQIQKSKIIIITTEGCESCKIIKNIIKGALEKGNYKVDVETHDKSDFDASFLRRYNIEDFPSTLFYDKDGVYKLKITGIVPSVEVSKKLSVFYS